MKDIEHTLEYMSAPLYRGFHPYGGVKVRRDGICRRNSPVWNAGIIVSHLKNELTKKDIKMSDSPFYKAMINELLDNEGERQAEKESMDAFWLEWKQKMGIL